MTHSGQPHEIDLWFPGKYRKPYVEHLTGLSAFTPKQAEYFVRLWGYGFLQQAGLEKTPITYLSSTVRPFQCSHKEAADLFYGKGEKSGRSAGNMIDTFCKKEYAKRESFSGASNTTRITLQNLGQLVLPDHAKNRDDHANDKIFTTDFEVRNDTKQVANMVDRLYAFDSQLPGSVQRNIELGLRDWAKRYPQGMRVLRYVDIESGIPEETIGIVAVFPVQEASEDVFYESPRNSFFLGTYERGMTDPIQYAGENDDCYAACIRCWQIKPSLWTFDNALMLFNETQAIIQSIQANYPDLADLYSIPIHPQMQKFALSLGFQLLHKGGLQDMHWLHIPVERFLSIEGERAISNFDFRSVSFM